MLVLAAIPLLMPFVMLLLLRQNGLHASPVKVKAVVRWIMQPPVRYRAD